MRLDDNALDDLLLNVAYLVAESGREATPETCAAILTKALFPDADVAELSICEREIYFRAKELLA
jgi:hypothetical protein